MPHFVSRLARSAAALFDGALLAWPLWTLALWAAHGFIGGLPALAFVAGVLGLWLGIGSAVLAVPTALLADRTSVLAPQTRTPSAWKDAGLAVAVAGGVGMVLLQLPAAWVPAAWGGQPAIHRMACWGVAVVVATAVHGLRTLRGGTLRAHRWVFGLLALLGSIAIEQDLARVSPPLVDTLGLATVAALLLFALGCGGSARHARLTRSVGLLAMLACAACAFGVQQVWKRGQDVELAGALAAQASVTLFDFDRDGNPVLPPGRDCDDWDPSVREGALEIVGNGVDDNCAGGDLLRSAEPARRTLARDRRRLHVVLITVDSVQARLLDPDQGARHMPQLARFAAQATHFRNHYAQASFTSDCVGAMMTGQYPMNFSESGQSLGAEPTIAELLRAAGYITATVNQVAESADWLGVRGFSDVDNALAAQHREHSAVTSPETTRRAIAKLDALRAQDAPFFFWVHYMDPHLWYVAHQGTPFPGTDDTARYHQEVWATDREVGKLLAHLESSGLLDDTLLLVTPDHGEKIGFGHSWFVSEEVLRTFLVLRAPGVPHGVFSTRTRAIDVYPTVLELAAGISAPSAGASLAPIWSGLETGDRDVYARSQYQTWSLRAAIRGKYKWVRDLRTGEESLYDLTAAGERMDVSEGLRVRELRDAAGVVWDEAINDRVLMRRARR